MFFSFIAIVFVLLGFAADGADPPTVAITPTPTPAPTVEYSPPPVVVQTPTDNEVRVQKLIDQMGGMSVPWYIGDECYETPGALACFKVDSNVIYIQAAGLANSDARLLCTLRHENRHAWQKAQGLIKFDSSGTISNREWLEADAKAASGCL